MQHWFQQEDFLRNPFPYYARMRAESPLRPDEAMGWVAFGHREVSALLREARLSSAVAPIFMAKVPAVLRLVCRNLEETLADLLLYMDPPRHTWLKNAVSPMLAPAAVRAQEARVRAVVDELLPSHPGSWDVIDGLADELPLRVVAGMLGLDVDPLRTWSHHLFAFLGSDRAVPEEILSTARLAGELRTWFIEHIRARRRAPQADLLSELVGQGLSDEDVADLAAVLVAAGDNTAGLIGNGVLTLLEHRDAWDDLCQQPDGLDTVLEELLRFAGPSQSVPRLALEDFDYEGHQIRKGQVLLLFISSANRDSSRYECGDEFWPTRAPQRHLAFGGGLHFCVGATLARLEVRVALEQLLARFPGTTLEGEPERYLNLAWRRLKHLPVRLDA